MYSLPDSRSYSTGPGVSTRVVLDGIRTGGAATRSYEGCDPVVSDASVNTVRFRAFSIVQYLPVQRQ